MLSTTLAQRQHVAELRSTLENVERIIGDIDATIAKWSANPEHNTLERLQDIERIGFLKGRRHELHRQLGELSAEVAEHEIAEWERSVRLSVGHGPPFPKFVRSDDVIADGARARKLSYLCGDEDDFNAQLVDLSYPPRWHTDPHDDQIEIDQGKCDECDGPIGPYLRSFEDTYGAEYERPMFHLYVETPNGRRFCEDCFEATP